MITRGKSSDYPPVFDAHGFEQRGQPSPSRRRGGTEKLQIFMFLSGIEYTDTKSGRKVYDKDETRRGQGGEKKLQESLKRKQRFCVCPDFDHLALKNVPVSTTKISYRRIRYM